MMKTLNIILVIIPFLLNCSGSIQDRINANRRLCGASVHGAAPLYNKNGERYTEAERSQLSLRTLTGLERADGITERACLDIPEGEEFLLVDSRERSFSVVSGGLALNEDLRLRPWSLPSFTWDCPADGRKMRRGRELTMTITEDFGLKGQTLHLHIQALDREWHRSDLLVEPTLGLKARSAYQTDWENGEYLATPVLTNPFGEKENLASGCRISMFTGTPGMEVDLDNEGRIFMDGTDKLPVEVDPTTDAYYCLASTDDDVCRDPTQFHKLSSWQMPQQGEHFTLHLRAQDAYGNVVERQPVALIVDRKAPELQLRWTESYRNRLGHVERLPFAYYRATVQLQDDISPKEVLADQLECRVRMQIDAVTTVAGSFAICDSGRCRGKRFEEWTPCSPEIAFRLDEALWKQFPASKEIILEVRTQDEREKKASDSAMVMIDPNLYPQFTADQWQGRMLDGIQDMAMISPNNYWLIRKTADDDSTPRQILAGVFGQWTAIDYPADLDPLTLHYSEGRFFVIFQALPQRQGLFLWEWVPAENRWQKPAGTEELKITEAAAIVDHNDPGTLWVAGSQPENAFTQILANGERHNFSCPRWDDLNRHETPKMLVQFARQLTLLYQDRYYTLDTANGECTLTPFPEYQGPALVLRRRTLFRDQKNRVWTTGKNQIDVLENGVWRHIDITRHRLHPTSGVTDGAYQFDDGSYVFIKAGDLTFIPSLDSLENFVFNKFNTKIVNGPAISDRGESYKGWEPTVFFDEGESILSVKGGLLTRSSSRPQRYYIPSQWGGGTAHLFRVEDKALYIGMYFSGLTRLSEKGLQRFHETSALPFNTVTSALFDQGRLVSIFGFSQWSAAYMVRRADLTTDGFKSDPAFESLDLRSTNGLRAAELDAKGRLWFSMADTGNYSLTGGNYVLEGNKLTKVQSCTVRGSNLSPMTCAEKFITLSSGEVFWRDNPTLVDKSALYDLYSWTEERGLVNATGSDQTFQKIYDATEHQGELWVSGIDQEQRGMLGVYRNQKWETEILPGDGAVHCARLGFNRKGELYCFGRYAGVLAKKDGNWSFYTTPGWTSPENPSLFDIDFIINGHRRYAYFEDGLVFISRRDGTVELWEVDPAPGWERWWLRFR